MRASDLQLEEVVSFSEGVLSLHGRRLILHDMNAFAQFRKDLMESLGPDGTRRALTRFGYFWGQADAAAMERIFKWDNSLELLRAGPRLQMMEGVAKTTVKAVELDGDRLRMEVSWHGSAEAEEHLASFGRSPDPSCWILTGYASGFSSFVLKRPVYFRESRCRARGDPICAATGMDEASWGKDVDELRAVFRNEDIQRKILDLTADLKRKTRELAIQRKRLESLEGTGRSRFAEVRSKAFQQVLDVATRVARFDSAVLISGESGTGKEVMARHIHDHSLRAKGPFVGINCGALPETLLESELFGHKAGAFTGAVRDRPGLFQEAAKGTIFLDEIGEVSPAMQVKLLRVLQEKEVRRVGEDRVQPTDVRVIAATNRDLDEAVKSGKFRKDLLYRLRVIEITVPPLRERPEDILPLARYFGRRLEERLRIKPLVIDSSCLEYLQNYSWPGNVRELENALERAAVLSEDGRIHPEHLPRNIVEGGRRSRSAAGSPLRTLEEVVREHIDAVLEHTEGNRTRTAKILGISATTLWRKLRER